MPGSRSQAKCILGSQCPCRSRPTQTIAAASTGRVACAVSSCATIDLGAAAASRATMDRKPHVVRTKHVPLTVLCSATPDACPRRMSASEWTRAGLEFTPQLCLCLCVDQGQFGPTTRHLQRSRSRSAGMLGIMRAQQSAATGPLATARAAADSSGCAMTRPWVAAALHCGQYRRTMAGDGRERWSVSVRSTVSLCGICATCNQRSVRRHWRRLG